MKNSFKDLAANENNPKWNNMIKREKELYSRNNDIRSEFERDYTRIIHSNAYKRMKHKTQVFFSPESDHICTRIEHVTHVESISYTIANYLGLNTELTKAIATAHDIGHSPFGHQGEKILSEISKRDIGIGFWHEKNGVTAVDKIELLQDNHGVMKNLNLTYAVRDGIISHCGEIDENNLKPREEAINLDDYIAPNQFAPYTWEGCVVKIADKISYLGRDIQDAIKLGILDDKIDKLHEILGCTASETLNNTVIINNLIDDLCKNSSPEKGLCFSEEGFKLINKIKDFNYKNIYLSERILPSNKYFNLIINEIYDTLKKCFNYENTIDKMNFMQTIYPKVIGNFKEWLSNYWNLERNSKLENDVLFNISNELDYNKAIILYIAGMTDNFAIETYINIVGF
ncbi:MAG: HD domain-containing protein [Clostridia bacterium]|nr:HD domain-containing protein [Clostridia bacterium]